MEKKLEDMDCFMCKHRYSTGMAKVSRCKLKDNGMFMTGERDDKACCFIKLKKKFTKW